MISVLLVDDEALVCTGLRMILETADDITVVVTRVTVARRSTRSTGTGPTSS